MLEIQLQVVALHGKIGKGQWSSLLWFYRDPFRENK